MLVVMVLVVLLLVMRLVVVLRYGSGAGSLVIMGLIYITFFTCSIAQIMTAARVVSTHPHPHCLSLPLPRTWTLYLPLSPHPPRPLSVPLPIAPSLLPSPFSPPSPSLSPSALSSPLVLSLPPGDPCTLLYLCGQGLCIGSKHGYSVEPILRCGRSMRRLER